MVTIQGYIAWLVRQTYQMNYLKKSDDIYTWEIVR